MSQPLTNCFTFLHRKTKYLLNYPTRPNNKKFSLATDDFSTSFVNMELSRQFQQVFKLIDTNGDGKISAAELGEVLSCLGHDGCVAAKEAEGMMSVLDFNGDGYVDLDEFMQVVGGKNKKDDQDECLKDAFLVFDVDKNGLISPKELKRVLVNLGCHDCSLRDCKRMIKGVDKNGDGFVDFDEFRCMMKKGGFAN